MKSCHLFITLFLFLFSFLGCSVLLAQEVPLQETKQKTAQELKGHIEELLQKGFTHREQIQSGQMAIVNHLTMWDRSSGSKSSVVREITLAFDEKRRRVDRHNIYSSAPPDNDIGCIGCYKKNNQLLLYYSNFVNRKEDDIVSKTAMTIYDEKQLEENVLTKFWTMDYGFIPQYLAYFCLTRFPTKEKIENAKSYLLLNTIGLMDSDRTKVNIAEEEYKGTLCKKIAFVFKGTDGSSISTTLWIAEEQGYALRKHFMQCRSKDVHYDELLETDVALDEDSGIWFPSAWHYERNNNGKPYISQDGTIKNTILNKPLPEKLFDMKDIKILPAGVLVFWQAEQVPPPYPGRLYWDGNDVVSREMYSTNLVEQNRNGGRFRRLFFVNVSVLALIAAWHLWRKYQQLKRQNEFFISVTSMSRTIRFKQNLVLFLFFLSCILSLAAAGAALGLFSSQEQNRSPVLPPLFAEPSILDFQKVNDGKHEGTVYLTNRSKKKINLLFARSSCSCSVAKLPGDTILPGERLPVKCTLSTVGQSGTVGGEILIAYRYFDSDEENVSPMYIPIVLKATVNTEL